MIRFSSTVTCQYDTPYAPFPATQFDQALAWLRDSGFDAAEVCISNYDGLDVPALKAKLDSYGLACSTLSTGQASGLEGISLLHQEEGARQRAQQRLLEHIDAAAILGSHVTLGLLRGVGDKSKLTEQKALLAHLLEPCIRRAQERHVTIILEPINRFQTSLFNSAQDAVDFITQDLGRPEGIGILWDTYHANMEDPDFEPAIAAMGPLLRYVHLSDSNRKMCGYGHIDYTMIYNLLQDYGFDGYCSFEVLNEPSVETVLAESGPFITGLRALNR